METDPARRALARRAARTVAAARVGLGTVAVLRPGLVAAPWVGRDDPLQTAVLGRALGGRDVALGAGALLAGHSAELAVWVAVAGCADLVDAAATLRSWRRLPSRGRWAVLLAAAGGAVASAAAAAELVGDRR